MLSSSFMTRECYLELILALGIVGGLFITGAVT